MLYTCKMCGGHLEDCDNNVAICPYCGTKQTISKSRDEVASNLFNRANELRMRCEFDKAEEVYGEILNMDYTDAEAHWGIVLCKYGIEYVEKPNSEIKVPTCHRTHFETVLTDSDYLDAIKYSDDNQRAIYSTEAIEIDRIQCGIKQIVNNEEPFDVFICYKEKDQNGERTMDSVLANDIYHQLTRVGYKVFFAAITLEKKLGQEYEPYIFSALSTAKVMLVLGTKPEYFEAVWVRNEWSRFLKFMKSDPTKLLIPCYRDMNAYNLPKEFAYLQAQDMSKIGFINDVIYGIQKVIGDKTQPAPAPNYVPTPPPAPASPVFPQQPSPTKTVEPNTQSVDYESTYKSIIVLSSAADFASWQEAIRLCDNIPQYKNVQTIKEDCLRRMQGHNDFVNEQINKAYEASVKRLKIFKGIMIFLWVSVIVWVVLSDVTPLAATFGPGFSLAAVVSSINHIIAVIKHKIKFHKVIRNLRNAKRF